MIVLGIETSCDETAAAIVQDGTILLSNVVASSMDLHIKYGGVVPEVAARSHIEHIIPVIEEALRAAFPPPTSHLPSSTPNSWSNIDAIAVTQGAGLGGSLLVGVMAARSLAITKNKPLYACNHVEGHVYANFLTSSGAPSQNLLLPPSPPAFPLLALIVSGGHSQLVLFRNHFDYVLLGRTHDDAIGEAFDKVAKMIGLPYPGGPSISKKALQGNAFAFDLPKAKLTHIPPALTVVRSQTSSPTSHLLSPISYDFSFSGLKTAVLRHAQAQSGHDYTYPSHKLPQSLSEAQKADIAAVFQRVAIETVVDKTVEAYNEFEPASVVLAGGVAANQELRKQLSERLPIKPHFTDPRLCTDNGAMIAALGCFKAMYGQPQADPYSLEVEPSLSM